MPLDLISEELTMQETLTQAHWTRRLAQDFRVVIGGIDSLTLRLISVTGFQHSSDPAREAYSLLFCGPEKPALSQRTYQLVHGEMGELDVFLVPIGPQKEGFGYEAIFN